MYVYVKECRKVGQRTVYPFYTNNGNEYGYVTVYTYFPYTDLTVDVTQ